MSNHDPSGIRWTSRMIARLGLAAMAGTCALAAGEAAAQQKLTIFSQPIPHYDAVWMADAKGLYKAEGLDITFRQFPTGVTALQSFRAGEGDIIFGGDFPGLTYWHSNNKNYRLIAALARDATSYLVTSKKTITKPQDLKGKIVATRVGSTVNWFMAEFLNKNGVGVKEVTVKNLDGQVMPAALCAGDIDAFFFWQPYNDKALEICGDKVHNLSDATGYIPGYVIAAARPEWLQNPDNAKKATAFLRATIKGKDIAEKDLDAVRAYGKEKFSMPENTIDAPWKTNVRMIALNDTVYKDYCSLAEWMRQENLIQGKVDLTDFVWTDGLKAIDPSRVTQAPPPC